jgi:hypothetical protein
MDKLIEFLTTKVGYVLTIVLGFIAPGNVLIFVWNRNMYLEMDIVKLLILSFSISFITFIPNLILTIIIYFIHGGDKELDNKAETKFDVLYYTGSAIVLAVIEIIITIFMAICTDNFQLSVYVMDFGIIMTCAAIILLMVLGIKRFRKK